MTLRQGFQRISIFIIITLSITSCTMNKRIYISNGTDQAITLKVDSAFTAKEGTMQAAFADSLNGKRIEPGHITIVYGSGKWSKNDEENLRWFWKI